MIVLGSLERTDNLTVVVPPFHTGHLGLIPGTEVHVGLQVPYQPGPRHCEVVVTPFSQPTANMALFKCTLRDRIGVVGRLVNAVSDLDVNIVTLESTVLNHLNHHLVTMLVDFSTSNLRHAPSGDRVRQLYAHFEPCFPVQDERFVRLFESIAVHSAGVWTTCQIADRVIPNLRLVPLSEHQFHGKEGSATVQRHKDRPFHVSITLPPEVGAPLSSRSRPRRRYSICCSLTPRNEHSAFSFLGPMLSPGFIMWASTTTTTQAPSRLCSDLSPPLNSTSLLAC